MKPILKRLNGFKNDFKWGFKGILSLVAGEISKKQIILLYEP
jgi:hypothetical protein